MSSSYTFCKKKKNYLYHMSFNCITETNARQLTEILQNFTTHETHTCTLTSRISCDNLHLGNLISLGWIAFQNKLPVKYKGIKNKWIIHVHLFISFQKKSTNKEHRSAMPKGKRYIYLWNLKRLSYTPL